MASFQTEINVYCFCHGNGGDGPELSDSCERVLSL